MNDAHPPSAGRRLWVFGAIAVVCAVLVFLIASLLMSIFERKQEARNPYVRLVEVREETTDPAAWGINWAREYDDYQRTAEVTKTTFGGSETLPDQKAKAHPWLTRMFAGYAFAPRWASTPRRRPPASSPRPSTSRGRASWPRARWQLARQSSDAPAPGRHEHAP